jgi:hypothetical protein
MIGPVDSAIAVPVAPTVPGMDDEIPPLLPPDQMPPIHTPQDMYRTWRALMGELGFGRRLLWFGFVSDAGRMAGQLHQVEGLPGEPDALRLDELMRICRDQVEIIVERGSVAFLLSRPGPGRMTDDDRRWARELAAAATRAGVRLQPIHLATDEALRVFAADDLILPRSA